MATVHNEIDKWLAADLHDELSDAERSALHAHLIDCAVCRKNHQETKAMNKILEETLVLQKPDLAFEQRMLANFRTRIPEKGRLVKVLADLMRLRAVQVTALAAVLLGLVQLGRIITGETAALQRGRDRYVNEQLSEEPSQGFLPAERNLSTLPGSQVAAMSQPDRRGALDKSDELAAARPKGLALLAPPPSSGASSELHKEFKDFSATVAPNKTAQAETAAKKTGGEEALNYLAEPS